MVKKHLFLILLASALALPLHASKVSLSLEPGDLFEQAQTASTYVQNSYEATQPSDTSRHTAAAIGIISDVGLNVALNHLLRKSDSVWAHMAAIASWLGGTTLIGWGYGKTILARQNLMQLYQRLIQLRKRPNLGKALSEYDTNTLESKRVRKAFKKFAARSFISDQVREVAAQQFLTEQINSIAKRLYWLSLIASGLGSATLTHFVVGTLPLKPI